MKKIIIFAVLALGIIVPLSAWHIGNRHITLGYNIGNANPVYGDVNEVPDGQSGVTALAVGTDGFVYGGTSCMDDGKSPYIIVYKTERNLVTTSKSLEKSIPGQKRIGAALAAGHDGFIYGGTSVYEDEPLADTNALIKKGYAGGHLFRFKEGKLEPEDLGIVDGGEGVRCITVDAKRGKIFGLTEPSYFFFVYDLKLKKIAVKKEPDLMVDKDYNSVGHRRQPLGLALIQDKSSKVWGSASGGKFFKYDPDSDKLEVTKFDYGFAHAHGDRDGISALALDSTGNIIGGTIADGMLFKFNPNTGAVIRLGKPVAFTWIRSLAVGKDGKVCGVVGQPGMTPLVFFYEDGGFNVMGEMFTYILRTSYTFYASELTPCVYLPEQGTYMFGNAGRIGKLFSLYNQ